MINPEIVIITSQYTPEQIWEGDETTLSAIRRRCVLIMLEQRDPNEVVQTDPNDAVPVSIVLPDRHVGTWDRRDISNPTSYVNGYRSYTTYELN